MENGLPIKLSRQQVQELTPLFGPPPVLSSEDAQHYDQTWQGLVACLVPQDFMELYLIRQVLNEIWKIARYTRHQAVGIERRFYTIREFQAQRTKEQKAERRIWLASWPKKLASRPLNWLGSSSSKGS
jgi:hypothetical protein